MCPRRRRRWAALLVAYLVGLGVVALWATAVDVPVEAQLDQLLAWFSARGLPLRYQHVEALANLLLFVPLGALLAGALADRLWWWAAPAGLLLSAALETAQLGLAGRTASVRDVLLNGAGALAGAAALRLAVAVSARRAARSGGWCRTEGRV